MMTFKPGQVLKLVESDYANKGQISYLYILDTNDDDMSRVKEFIINADGTHDLSVDGWISNEAITAWYKSNLGEYANGCLSTVIDPDEIKLVKMMVV